MDQSKKQKNLLVIPIVLSLICAYFLYNWGSPFGAFIMLFLSLFISPFNKFFDGQLKVALSVFLFFTSVFVSAFQISNNGYQANQVADEIEKRIAPPIKPVPPSGSASDVPSYSVESKEERPPIKATYYIRIPKRYEPEQIKQIATKIKTGIDQKYENIFMFYLLQDSSKDTGAYATSHYKPTLDVILNDLSESQVKSANTKQINKGAEIIGKFAQPYTKAIVTIRKEGNGYIFNERYPDGSEGDTKMLHKTKNGQVIWSRTFNDGDGYYIIKSGDLVLIDEDNGMEMSVSKPIQ